MLVGHFRILYVIRPIGILPCIKLEIKESFKLSGDMEIRECVTTLQCEFWTSCNLLNPKLVSDANKDLQSSNLLLI